MFGRDVLLLVLGLVLVLVLAISMSAGDDVDEEADEREEVVEVLRERGRVGRRWCMRWEAVGQRGRVDVGGEEVGGVRVPLLLLPPEMLLRLAGEREPRWLGLVAGLGKLLRDE